MSTSSPVSLWPEKTFSHCVSVSQWWVLSVVSQISRADPQFIDAAGVSATFIMTSPISAPDELNIVVTDQAWVLASYSMCFAALLLLAGRLADLYPPHLVYLSGFAGLAVFNLIIS
jgi:MFS family permease